MKKRSALKSAGVVLSILLCAVFLFALVCNVVIIVKGTISPETPPSVFGITPMVVLSGSMSGTDDGHIEVGDLIFDVKADTEKLAVGDVVSFMEDGVVVTHRITKITSTDGGERRFITKGDANNTEDPEIGEADIVGKCVGRIPKLGDFAMFLQKPLGMAVFIGIPVCAFIVYDVLRRRSAARREAREKEELCSQLEKLRKDSDGAGDGSDDGGR